MKVSDSLRQSAEFFEERGKIYGDAYKNFGPVMKALFPGGIRLEIGGDSDFNRLGVLTQIVMKIVRYANQFEAGGHDDSLLDLSTYAAMLRELDAEGRAKFEAPFPFELNESRASFEPKPGRPPWKAEIEIEPVVPRREPTHGFPGETVEEMRERLGADRSKSPPLCDPFPWEMIHE